MSNTVVTDSIGSEIKVGQLAYKLDNKYLYPCEICSVNSRNKIGIRSSSTSPVRYTYGSRLLVETSVTRDIPFQ